MKLTYLLTTIILALYASTSFATVADSIDSKHAVHHFDILIGNYVGKSVLNASSNPAKAYYTSPGQLSYSNMQGIVGPFGAWYGVFGKVHYKPGYCASFGFNYHADLGKQFGLRTGLNYSCYGYVATGTFEGSVDGSPPYVNSTQTYSRHVYTSMLQIPVQFMVYHKLKKGRLVFSLGPDIYLPFYYSGSESVYTPSSATFSPDNPVVTMRLGNTLSATDILRGGTLGLSAALGYDKQVSKNVAISVMPDFHLLNLVPFYLKGQGKGLYQNYTFNTATGVSVYLTFSR